MLPLPASLEDAGFNIAAQIAPLEKLSLAVLTSLHQGWRLTRILIG
jgi:hypothetical protein